MQIFLCKKNVLCTKGVCKVNEHPSHNTFVAMHLLSHDSVFVGGIPVFVQALPQFYLSAMQPEQKHDIYTRKLISFHFGVLCVHLFSIIFSPNKFCPWIWSGITRWATKSSRVLRLLHGEASNYFITSSFWYNAEIIRIYKGTISWDAL